MTRIPQLPAPRRCLPLLCFLLSAFAPANMDSTMAAETTATAARWTPGQAREWLEKMPYLAGSNYIPSTAINQLEMWQPETFDPETIDRELALAKSLGFTSMRVFLHDIPWRQDAAGCLNRIDQYLTISSRHGIGAMFVLFDSVWNPFPRPGPQPAPRPGVMGSAWVQSPGAEILGDEARHDSLKPYVQGILKRFADDPRVQVWDLMNEPDNPVPQYRYVELPNKAEAARKLLEKTFAWARETSPSQPLTSGVWMGNWPDPAKLSPMEQLQLSQSDIISFHSYGNFDEMKRCVENLKRYDRPLLCTEYIARPLGSTFDPILGYLADRKVGAYNWGFLLGKTQTNFPWDSWEKPYTSEPPLWFHDIFRPDGTPYRQAEVDYIRRVLKRP